jgi:hypothetical protein
MSIFGNGTLNISPALIEAAIIVLKGMILRNSAQSLGFSSSAKLTSIAVLKSGHSIVMVRDTFGLLS